VYSKTIKKNIMKNQITKSEVRQLIANGKVENLMKYCVYFNDSQLESAIYQMLNTKEGSYVVSFQSLPYSKGGKYARHTSTLTSLQEWKVVLWNDKYYVETYSSSKSAACPSVKVPKFGTKSAFDRANKIAEKAAIKAANLEAKNKAKAEAKRKKIQAKKQKENALRLKKLAAKNGFKSVAEMKRVNNENITYNAERMNRALKLRVVRFVGIHGHEPQMHKIADRVKISRIDLEFDCEAKPIYA
jgi:hypothetical protein